MSTSEPFMPNLINDEPTLDEETSVDNELTLEEDRGQDRATDDAVVGTGDATPDEASSSQDDTPFRTPMPGERLSPEQLAQED